LDGICDIIQIEADPDWKTRKTINSIRDPKDPSIIHCYDPATGYSLGSVNVIPPEQVPLLVQRAKLAQQIYAQTSFDKRRALLNTLLDFVVTHQDLICRVACRDSGKTRMKEIQ
jgi:acyl-CoA reductase-like NAD-dependent aldehyde dehydrogenase